MVVESIKSNVNGHLSYFLDYVCNWLKYFEIKVFKVKFKFFNLKVYVRDILTKKYH